MRVYVGLSGGVDSSVGAAILKRKGYHVTGVYMKNWTRDLPGVECPWKQDLADSRAVAATLGIPFKVYDFQDEYKQNVVDYMIAEYQAGRTPNPDIMCNQEIKFKLFWQAAMADGADMIATGHYASVEGGRLLRGKDDNKDQTYFLYRTSGEVLTKSLMPMGEFTKPQVRKLAAGWQLPTANKKDSQGICFVGPVGLKAFLKQYVKTDPGPIVNNDGQQIGEHDGAVFYTIGQRQGLGVGGGKPFYVTGKDMASNTVYVTDDPGDLDLQTDELTLEDFHWINPPLKQCSVMPDCDRVSDPPVKPVLPAGGSGDDKRGLQVRLRHRGPLVDCGVRGNVLSLMSPQKAVAPGQSAVIYDGRQVLGGGIIASAKVKSAV